MVHVPTIPFILANPKAIAYGETICSTPPSILLLILELIDT